MAAKSGGGGTRLLFRYFLGSVLTSSSDRPTVNQKASLNIQTVLKSHANSASGALSIPMLVISIRSSSRSD